MCAILFVAFIREGISTSYSNLEKLSSLPYVYILYHNFPKRPKVFDSVIHKKLFKEQLF